MSGINLPAIKGAIGPRDGWNILVKHADDAAAVEVIAWRNADAEMREVRRARIAYMALKRGDLPDIVARVRDGLFPPEDRK